MGAFGTTLQPFLAWLLETTLVASVVICLILVLQKLLGRRLGPRWSHALWLVLLLRMILPWTPPSPVSLFSLIAAPLQRDDARETTDRIPRDDALRPTDGAETAKETTAAAPEPAESLAEPVKPRPQEIVRTAHPPARLLTAIRRMLPVLWLVGATLLGGYLAASNFALWRIIKREHPLVEQPILELFEQCKSEMGVETIVALVPSDRVRTAALFGFVRPRLLLPREMIDAASPEELRYIFLHELAHLKRYDIYIGWLTSLLQVLHWFNPLVWLAFYRMRSDRELACDALVLTRTKEEESHNYGRTMVGLLGRFSRSRPLPAMAGILESKSQLKRRIAMIAKFKDNSYQWSPLAVILIVILGCVSLPDAKRTKAAGISAAKPSAIVVRQVWTDAADPQFLGAPSPDGKYLSYVDWETGYLSVHELATGKNRRLTNKGRSEGSVGNSVFSPDSRQVAYFWWSQEKGSELHIVGLDGSGPRVVNRDEEASIYSRGIYPTGWTPDGKHILALGRRGDRSLEILLVPVEDGPVRILKTLGKKLPGGRRVPGLCLSPDGRYVAYTFLPDEESMNRDISVIATDGSHEIPLEKHPADDFVLGWAPDSKRVVFASDRTGSMGLWAVDVAEGKMQGAPQLLKPDVGQFYPLGLTQNGSFYYGVYAGSCNVYTATYDPQKEDITAKPVIAVHRYEGSNWAPDWSPDGKYLACVSASPGVSPVFLIRSVKSGEVRKLSPDLRDFNLHSLRWSADGRFLLGSGKTKDVFWGVLKIDVETGEVTVIVEGPGIFGPHWAADGKAVFYVCNLKRNGGIIRHDLATGEKKELYNAPGFISALVLSPDGQQLAFYDIQGSALKVLSTTGGEPRELVKVEGRITIAWTPDGRQLVYGSLGLGEGPGNLWRISTGGGEPQKLDLEMPHLSHVRFHPDGRQIAFTGSIGKNKCEVWVMENFLPGAPTAKAEAVSGARAAVDVPQTGLVMREVKIKQGESGLSLSRDGKQLVYPKRKDGKTNLVVRDLASGEETQITNHETGAARYPVFSPDGKEIVYTLAQGMRNQKLHIVSLETGEDRDLGQYGFAQDWSKDGRFILFSPWQEEDKQTTYDMLVVSEGTVKELNVPISRSLMGPPRFSPDAKYISYSHRGNVYLYHVDNADVVRITQRPAAYQPLWSLDGKMLFFISPQAFGPEADLCGVSIVDGKAVGGVQIIKPDFGDYVNLFSLSDAGRLLYRQIHFEAHSYSTEVDPQRNQPIGKPVKLVDRERATWSPDGKRIAYISGALHVMSADGSNDRKIIQVNPFKGPYAWAPDNDHIYIVERVEDRAGIYSISISAKEARPVFLDPDIMGHVTCSPDGKRLAFLKLPESSGKSEIFTVNVDGTNLRQLTSDDNANVMYTAWSPDGKYIAFASKRQDIRALRVVSVDDGTTRDLFRGETPEDQFHWVSWSPDGSKIVWTSSGEIRIGQVSDGKYNTFRVDVGGPARSTFHMPRLSPDGTKMLFFTWASVQHLMLMDNFLPPSDEAK